MATPVHGFVSAFDSTQEDWVKYAKRLEHYFVANTIASEDIQRAILLTNVGPATYRLIKTLSLPRKPTDYSFSDLVKIVKSHFHPKPSPIMKRFEWSQQEGETVGVFVAALRSIAEHCEYPEDILNDMLRDRIVCGLRDKAVQRGLLKESKLTYQLALDTALAAEVAANDAKQLHDTHRQPLPVHHVNSKQRKQPMDRVKQSAIVVEASIRPHNVTLRTMIVISVKRRVTWLLSIGRRKHKQSQRLTLKKGMSLMQWKERKQMRITHYSKSLVRHHVNPY